MSQGCAMVLLLAMMLAMAAGMLAWGPVGTTPADHAFADQRAWLGIPHAVNVLTCLPLGAVAAWGLRLMWRRRPPESLRKPWTAFFTLCAATSAAGVLYHLNPSDSACALSHVLTAATMMALMLGFLAERVDALFGSGPALVAGCSVACFAGLWWWAGQWVGGRGDLRALLFLESLPLLLIPAGGLGLPGQHTPARDWMAMLMLYALARVAGLVDAPVYAATGWISGHAAMHLLLAGVAACFAYRVALASGPWQSSAAALPEPTQRSTSLNTSA